MKLNKFVPLTKMEEQADGTLLVFGTVTAEQPDLENEVCDYAGTKPFYQAKVATMFKLTSAVEGMTPSIMPMREMHQLKAVGAGRTIEFDDAAKTIKMGFQVVDPTTVAKFRNGVLVGFSQGGSYVGELIADPVHAGCKRYVADPQEVSAVDTPCLPSALVETMKGKTVTLMKAGGVTEEVHLQIPSLDGQRLDKMEQTVAQLTRIFKREFSEDERKKLADEGKALPDGSFPIENEEDLKNAIHAYGRASDKEKAKKHIIARAKALGLMNLIPDDWTSEKDKVAAARACAKIALAKGLYEVGWLASLLEDLHWLCLQSEFERDLEDDGSKVPENLRGAWLELLAQFKAMAVEEADELAAQGGKGAGMKITTADDLKKAAKTLHEHLEKHMEMHKAHHEKLEGMLAKDHPMVKSSQAMMDHCEKCMKAAKDTMDGEEPEAESKEKTAPEGAVSKADFDALKSELSTLIAKLAATPAGGGAHAGGPQTVAKVAPVTGFEDVPVAAVAK